jgi:hypothetical protein
MTKQILVCAMVSLGFDLSAHAQNNDAADAAKAPVALARKTLAARLNIDAASLEVISSTPQTWPDSSLGCGKPGSAAAQVLTPGYAIVLKAPAGNYRVHATEKYAVICDSETPLRNPRNVGLSVKGLNEKIEVARTDLAQKLGAPLAEIRVANLAPTDWPDSSMDCAIADEPVSKKPIKGYRVALRYQGRIYTYHTDLDRVRACPPVETN